MVYNSFSFIIHLNDRIQASSEIYVFEMGNIALTRVELLTVS